MASVASTETTTQVDAAASAPTMSAGRPERRTSYGGVLASVFASVLFGVLFLLSPLMDGLDANEVFGWRVLVTPPVVVAVFFATKRWGDVVRVARRLRRAPALIPVAVINGGLLGVQIWIFGWAPQAGHGLDTALGYLLLPLVMVLVGTLLHKERLTGLRVAAVASAGVGVFAALVLAGGLSLVTVVVALGYPAYFTLRRRAGLDSAGALVFELGVLLPVAVWMLAQSGSFATVAVSPALMLGVLLLGLVSALALVLYLAASNSLPFGIFGLLTYLEPVLLVIVAILFLGEQPHESDLFVYAPIAVALALLGVEPFLRKGAKKRS